MYYRYTVCEFGHFSNMYVFRAFFIRILAVFFYYIVLRIFSIILLNAKRIKA